MKLGNLQPISFLSIDCVLVLMHHGFDHLGHLCLKLIFVKSVLSHPIIKTKELLKQITEFPSFFWTEVVPCCFLGIHKNFLALVTIQQQHIHKHNTSVLHAGEIFEGGDSPREVDRREVP